MLKRQYPGSVVPLAMFLHPRRLQHWIQDALHIQGLKLMISLKRRRNLSSQLLVTKQAYQDKGVHHDSNHICLKYKLDFDLYFESHLLQQFDIFP